MESNFVGAGLGLDGESPQRPDNVISWKQSPSKPRWSRSRRSASSAPDGVTAVSNVLSSLARGLEHASGDTAFSNEDDGFSFATGGFVSPQGHHRKTSDSADGKERTSERRRTRTLQKYQLIDLIKQVGVAAFGKPSAPASTPTPTTVHSSSLPTGMSPNTAASSGPSHGSEFTSSSQPDGGSDTPPANPDEPCSSFPALSSVTPVCCPPATPAGSANIHAAPARRVIPKDDSPNSEAMAQLYARLEESILSQHSILEAASSSFPLVQSGPVSLIDRPPLRKALHFPPESATPVETEALTTPIRVDHPVSSTPACKSSAERIVHVMQGLATRVAGSGCVTRDVEDAAFLELWACTDSELHTLARGSACESPPDSSDPTVQSPPATKRTDAVDVDAVVNEPEDGDVIPPSLSFRTASNKVMLPPRLQGVKRARALMSEADAQLTADDVQPTESPRAAPHRPALSPVVEEIPDELMLLALEMSGSVPAATVTPPPGPAVDTLPYNAARPTLLEAVPCPHSTVNVAKCWQEYWAKGGCGGDGDPRYLWCMVSADSGMDAKWTRTISVWCVSGQQSDSPCCACGVVASGCECGKVASQREVHLSGEWADTPLLPGDVVHIIPIQEAGEISSPTASSLPSEGPIVIDACQNALILLPDTMITPSRITASMTCLRRGVLCDYTVGADDGAKTAMLGTLKHSLFEYAVSNNCMDTALLQDVSRELVRDPEIVQRLYQCGESESGALTSLFSAIPVVQSWAASFRASSPSAGGHDVDAGPAGRTRVAVTAIHSVEDKMWSPMWGLKGVLDLTVDVKSQAVTAARGMQRSNTWAGSRPTETIGSFGSKAVGPVTSSRLPLELKTGKQSSNGGSVSHRAQVSIYSLLLSDRRWHMEHHLSNPVCLSQQPEPVNASTSRKYATSDDGDDFDLALIAATDFHASQATAVPQRSVTPVASSSRSLLPKPVKPSSSIITAGLLLYLSQGGHSKRSVSLAEGTGAAHDEDVGFSMFGVPLVWAEMKSLLVRRNEFVGATRDVLVPPSRDAVSSGSYGGPHLPPMIDDSFMCDNCAVKTACFALGAAALASPSHLPTTVEEVREYLTTRTESAGLRNMKASFSEVTVHLLPVHLAYLRKWWGLLDMESAGDADVDVATNAVNETGFWNIPADVREKQTSRCVSSLRLTDCRRETLMPASLGGTASQAQMGLAEHRAGYVLSFRRHSCASSVELRSILELDFGVGDRVVVSTQGGLCGVCDGDVVSVSPSDIVIRTSSCVPEEYLGYLSASVRPIRSTSVGDIESFGQSRMPSPTAETLWRLDKNDASAPDRIAKDNLIRLLMGPLPADARDFVSSQEALAASTLGPGDWRRIRSVIELAPPTFSDSLNVLPWCNLSLPRNPSQSARLAQLQSEYCQLNSDQQQAVLKVLQCEDYTCLLGMPGSGKTATIAFIVRCLVASGLSVFVTAYTHTAVDSVLLKLVVLSEDHSVSVCRLGRKSAVHADLHHVSLEALTELSCPSNRRIDTVQQYTHTLETAQVVGASCLGVSHPVFSRRMFDVVIVDEASQVTEPVCVGPLRCGKRFVLVGDHHQLPPLVRNRDAAAAGMDVSLFKRLCDAHPQAVAELRMQYRMNADIQVMSNVLVYNNALRCGNEEVANAKLALSGCVVGDSPEWLLAVLNPACTVAFVNTDPLATIGAENSTRWSGRDARQFRMVNSCEVAVVASVVAAAVSCGCPPSNIGIISPYRAQLRLMRTILAPEFSDIEVDTVDRYQGRDKDVIVVSCVRSNGEGEVGKLLSDLRRLNVALTRAKKKMIVVGSASTLNCCPVTQRMMGVFAARNWILHLPRDVTSVFGGPCKDWFVKSFAACNETPTIDWPTHSSTVCDASPSVETVLKLSPVVNEVVQPQSRLSLTKRPRFGLSSSKEITGLRSCGMKEEPPGAPTSSVPVEEMETADLVSPSKPMGSKPFSSPLSLSQSRPPRAGLGKPKPKR